MADNIDIVKADRRERHSPCGSLSLPAQRYYSIEIRLLVYFIFPAKTSS